MKIALGVIWIGLRFLYFQVFSFRPLTYDDPLFLSLHPAADFPLISLPFWQTLLNSPTANLWHPLTDLSHQLLYRLSQSPPLHLGCNVLLHGFNASLLLFLLKRITGNILLSLALSLLFAWHPITIESTAWISGRKDLLCTFFLLLAVIHYHEQTEKRTSFFLPKMVFLSLAACFSKPIAFTLPLLLLAIDYWPIRRKISLKVLLIEKWPFWLISISSIISTILIQSGGTQSLDDNRSIVIRLTEALWALQRSLRSLLVPFNLHFVYANPEHLSLGWISALLVTGGLVAVFLVWKKKDLPSALMGIFWYLITLGPTLGLLRAGNNLAADRYSYLPLVGLIIGISGIHSLQLRSKHQFFVLFAIAALFLPLSFNQISHWRSQEALFTNVLKNDPDNLIARVELANLSFRAGRYSDTEEQLKPILAANPNSPGAHLLLGHIAYERKKYSQAYQHYQIAAETRRHEAFIEERLTASAHGMGDLEKAHFHLSSALEKERSSDKNLELAKKWQLIFPDTPLPNKSGHSHDH